MLLDADFELLLFRLLLLFFYRLRLSLPDVNQQSERDLKRRPHHVLVRGDISNEGDRQVGDLFTAKFCFAEL